VNFWISGEIIIFSRMKTLQGFFIAAGKAAEDCRNGCHCETCIRTAVSLWFMRRY